MLRGIQPLPSFATEEHFVDHCFAAHGWRLGLDACIDANDRWAPAAAAARADRGALYGERARWARDLPPTSLHTGYRQRCGQDRVEGSASVARLVGAEWIAARALPHLIIVDAANIRNAFALLNDVDPSAEVTLRDCLCSFLVICEPPVNVGRDVVGPKYGRAMFEHNRLLLLRSHGGVEAGDLVTTDIAARLSEEASAGAVTLHLLTNDRRMVKCVKEGCGRETPVIEHHCFERCGPRWHAALCDMLAMTYREPLAASVS